MRANLSRLRAVLFGVVGLLVLAACWDLYKYFGPEDGVRLGERVLILPRASDLAMPHSWEIFSRLTEPVTRGPGSPEVWRQVYDASSFSLGIAARGWLIGVAVGLLLAFVMSGLRIAEKALLPWVVLSQTVPLIAIAPLVRRWGTQGPMSDLGWTSEHSVAVIAAYLAFFPIAIGALRGLKSPTAAQLDLMHAYGVGWWRSLLPLRLPASLPFLLPALRLAAASAVIGTVVAEVSIGLRGGIGRMVIDYAQSASGDPAKAWAPIIGAVVIGLVAAGAVGLIGLILRPFHLTGERA